MHSRESSVDQIRGFCCTRPTTHSSKKGERRSWSGGHQEVKTTNNHPLKQMITHSRTNNNVSVSGVEWSLSRSWSRSVCQTYVILYNSPHYTTLLVDACWNAPPSWGRSGSDHTTIMGQKIWLTGDFCCHFSTGAICITEQINWSVEWMDARYLFTLECEGTIWADDGRGFSFLVYFWRGQK